MSNVVDFRTLVRSDGKRRIAAHRLVASVAREACEELYEVVMSNNAVRREWKRLNEGCSERELVKRFVDRNWGRCIPYARATLTILMQQTPNSFLREDIFDALAKDQSLGH